MLLFQQQIGLFRPPQPPQLNPACHSVTLRCNIACCQQRSAGRHQSCKAAAEQQQAAPTPPLQEQRLPDGVDPEQLLGTLSRISNYTQLAAFVQSQPEAFLQTPLCVYALLHAVQLRDMLSFDKLGQGSFMSEEQVLQQYELVESLLDQLCAAAVPHVPTLPLLSQATLMLALAQLEYYDPPLIEALADALKASLATPQQQQQQQQRQRGDPSSSGSSSEAVKAAALAQLPEGLVPGVLLSVAVACSLTGHHDQQLLDRVADQAVAFRSAFTNHGPLVSLAAALLDLQHDHPALLAAAAAAATSAAADQQGLLQCEEVISLLLALGFFRVGAPEFVVPSLQALAESADELVELDGLQLSRLWKALLLLRDDGVKLPGELVEALQFAADQLQQQSPDDSDLLLLGSCKGQLLLHSLQEDFASGLSNANPLMLQHWEEAGPLPALFVLEQLQKLGYKLEQGVEVPVGQGLDLGSEAGQHQGALELPPAKTDLSFVLQDRQTGEAQRVAVVLLFDDRYCVNPQNRLRGAAAVDILALQALGLSVLPLPLQEWQALGNDTDEQQRYLKARVAAATS